MILKAQHKVLHLFRKENLIMSTDDIAAPSVTLNKRPLSHKHRIHSHSPSARKTRTDEFRLNRTMTAINRPPSKLPALPAKVSIYSSPSGNYLSDFIHKNNAIQRLSFTTFEN
jgi:hypothetical protein